MRSPLHSARATSSSPACTAASYRRPSASTGGMMPAGAWARRGRVGRRGRGRERAREGDREGRGGEGGGEREGEGGACDELRVRVGLLAKVDQLDEHLDTLVKERLVVERRKREPDQRRRHQAVRGHRLRLEPRSSAAEARLDERGGAAALLLHLPQERHHLRSKGERLREPSHARSFSRSPAAVAAAATLLLLLPLQEHLRAGAAQQPAELVAPPRHDGDLRARGTG